MDNSEIFKDDAERLAYEEFVATQEPVEGFALDKPALVCRWRMANKRVPMLNRHIRALSQRKVNGEPLTHNMLSWAKQHVEWSLTEGSYTEVNGVLMLVIDVNGNAAMTVGAYEPLEDVSAEALMKRAEDAAAEAQETGVAPELLATVENGILTLAVPENQPLCGTATLIEQLAQTRGLEVKRVDTPASLEGEPFLISDEHGVVLTANAGEEATFFKASYDKLRASTK